jgi:RimJ/RimL family protein N-acetyltransferase
MLELGQKLVNRSDLYMRVLDKNDFFEFRRAATESTETNYDYLAYGALFENLNIFDSSKAYKIFLEDENYDHWGVFHRKELVGHIGFSYASGPFGTELLGWVRKGYQSQGIGEISLQTACAMAFNQRSFNYVELRIKASNKPSRRAAEKVGFIPVLKLGVDVIGGNDPFIVYIKINPEIQKLASLNGYRPIDIMNNPATQIPLRYMLKNPNVLDFYSWPFPPFSEEGAEVDFFVYHGYMAILSLSPDDLDKLIERQDAAAGDGVYN